MRTRPRARCAADVTSSAAVHAGAPWVVSSSVGGAERNTGIPHLESERRVEEHLGASGLAYALVRPTFLDESLRGQLPTDGQPFTLRLPVPGDVAPQMVAVRDIGRTVARVLSAELADGVLDLRTWAADARATAAAGR